MFSNGCQNCLRFWMVSQLIYYLLADYLYRNSTAFVYVNSLDNGYILLPVLTGAVSQLIELAAVLWAALVFN